MVRCNGKGSHSQLQSMRARLRKASCMNDDAFDDDAPDDQLPHPQPAVADPTPDLEQQRDDGGESYEQLQSAFFARLPAEVRRMIYRAVWRSSNPLMKMHLHACCDGPRLTATACRYVPKADYSTRDDEVDPMLRDPWPGWRGRNQPPRWFWHAWGLRLRWGVHWKCQAAAMLSWEAKGDGTCVDRSKGVGGWLPVFLTCRRMYAEAIESLFESTTLIFTASEDAYRFFVSNPHSHLSKIHKLDFEFTHFKDHLFLQRIDQSTHPRLGDVGSSVPVAWELWTPLMRAVREHVPQLREFRVVVSPPSRRGTEEFYRFLSDWESAGHGGWVEERTEGVVYLEYSTWKPEMDRVPGQRPGHVAKSPENPGEDALETISDVL